MGIFYFGRGCCDSSDVSTNPKPETRYFRFYFGRCLSVTTPPRMVSSDSRPFPMSDGFGLSWGCISIVGARKAPKETTRASSIMSNRWCVLEQRKTCALIVLQDMLNLKKLKYQKIREYRNRVIV